MIQPSSSKTSLDPMVEEYLDSLRSAVQGRIDDTENVGAGVLLAVLNVLTVILSRTMKQAGFTERFCAQPIFTRTAPVNRSRGYF